MQRPVTGLTKSHATAKIWPPPRKLLAAAVTSIVGKKEERAVASLFSPGGTHAAKGGVCRHERF